MVAIIAGVYIGDKIPKELVSLYEWLASDSQQKAIQGKRVGVHEVNAMGFGFIGCQIESSDATTFKSDNSISGIMCLLSHVCALCSWLL